LKDLNSNLHLLSASHERDLDVVSRLRNFLFKVGCRVQGFGLEVCCLVTGPEFRVQGAAWLDESRV
jgi:hypothetical protein